MATEDEPNTVRGMVGLLDVHGDEINAEWYERKLIASKVEWKIRSRGQWKIAVAIIVEPTGRVRARNLVKPPTVISGDTLTLYVDGFRVT